MMMGGTITHDKKHNKFVARGNSVKNRLQAKFYNVDLPDLFGLPRYNANALIAFLKEQGMDNLKGNYRSQYGFNMANISHHTTLRILGHIISVFIDRKLRTLETTEEKRQLLQKMRNVQTSLEKQVEKRKEDDEESGHHKYANGLRMHVVRPLETSIDSLTEMTEKAGKVEESNKKSTKMDGTIDMAAFVPLGPSMMSSTARAKKPSSMTSSTARAKKPSSMTPIMVAKSIALKSPARSSADFANIATRATSEWHANADAHAMKVRSR